MVLSVWSDAIKVAIVGFSGVFFVLTVIMGIISSFNYIFHYKEKKEAKNLINHKNGGVKDGIPSNSTNDR